MTASSVTDEQFAQYQRMVSALGIGDFSSLLVHYTSVATLEAILDSRELWFGRLSDLKDTAECDHFIDGVLQNAKSLLAKHGLSHMPVVVSDIPWRGDQAA